MTTTLYHGVRQVVRIPKQKGKSYSDRTHMQNNNNNNNNANKFKEEFTEFTVIELR